MSPQDALRQIAVDRALQRLQMEKDYKAALELDKQNKMKQQQAAIGRGFQLDAMHRQVANQPLPPTYTPQRKELPAQAPRFSPRDPSIAIAQPLSLIAALGGLFARRAGTAAIRSMTAAMEGLREADQQKYENAIREFDQNLKLTQEYNRAEHEKYQEAWDNRKNTWAERVAKLQMLSTQYGNTALQNALSTGNAELIEKQLHMMDGGDKAIDNLIKLHGTGAGHAMDTEKAAAVQERKRELMANGMQEGEAHTTAIREQTAGGSQEQRIEIEGVKSQNKVNEAIKKLEAKMPGLEGRFKNMGEVKAAAVNAHLKQLSGAHPEWPLEERLIRAIHEAAPDTLASGWSKLSLGLQNQIEQGWAPEIANDLKGRIFTASEPDKRRLLSAGAVLSSSEKVAKFVAEDPEAVGVLASFYKSVKADPYTWSEVRAKEYVDSVDRQLAAQALPSGAKITKSVAERAAVLNKMVFQMSLDAAAQVSTNGQGGTVFLDRQFRDVFSQMASPSAMFDILRTRNDEANTVWTERFDPRLDWHNRLDKDKRPFFENPSAYEETAIFHAYDRVPPERLMQVINTDKHLAQYPQMREALQLSVKIRDEATLRAWADQQAKAAEAGQITREQWELDKGAIIILRNVFRVHAAGQ